DGSEEDRSGLARELRDAALLGAAEVERACRAAERLAAACRVLVDPIIELLAAAERELGEPSSPATLDLERRRSARAAHPARNLTFVDKHGDGVAAVSRRDGRAWWLQRFVEKHGVEPPSGWWQEEPDLPLGGRLSAEHRGDDWFDAEDERAFAAEMETRYRLEAELPGPGEGWVSQAHLTHCLRTVLPGHEIVSEARLEWLGGQRLDAYVPSLGLALEYQGEQHFVPLPHWGGEAGLAARRELDERKRDACARAGVRLLEWRYDEPVSVESVRARLERAGVIPS
ncbi:MAG TPA: hypothetical protein VIV06_04870, partial [Candidatus Limnocylindrales bacterium]